MDEIVTPDVFTASKPLRAINSFTRNDGTPLNYSLVNLKDWCKNHFEVVNRLRIKTDNSHHHFEGQRYELDGYVIMPNHLHVFGPAIEWRWVA